MTDSSVTVAQAQAANEAALLAALDSLPTSATDVNGFSGAIGDTASASDPNGFDAAVGIASQASDTTGLDTAAGIASTDQTNSDTGTGLISLDAPTLSLFNEIGVAPTSATVTGDLTAQQLQELGILQADAQKLEEASAATAHIPLTGSATTIDLSAEAQLLAAANTNTPPASASAGTAASATAQADLTSSQLAQIGQVVAPVSNEALTSDLLLQIQNQLTALQIDPLQLSLNALMQSQNYLNQGSAHDTPEEVVAMQEQHGTVGPAAPVAAADQVRFQAR